MRPFRQQLRTADTHVSQQVDEVAVLTMVAAVPLPADDLEQQHAEAVHVGLDREDALGSVLGSHVATVSVRKECQFVARQKLKLSSSGVCGC